MLLFWIFIYDIKGTHDQNNKPFKTQKQNLPSRINTHTIQVAINILQYKIDQLVYMVQMAYKQNQDKESVNNCARKCLNCLQQVNDKIKEALDTHNIQQNVVNVFDSDRLPQSQDYFGYYQDYGEFPQVGELPQEGEFRQDRQVPQEGEFPKVRDLNTIKTAQISPDEQHLVICSDYKLQIWNLNSKERINTIIYKNELSAFNFYNDQLIAVGDCQGYISTIFNYNVRSIQHQIHKGEVYQILFKNMKQVISNSRDNTIKITDLVQGKLIIKINYILSGFSGFDYNKFNNIIIAPNDDFISIWKSDYQYESLKSVKLFDRECISFIQAIFSTDGNKAIISLRDYGKIVILEINMDRKQISILKEIDIDKSTYNISYCLKDQAILYTTRRYYELFNIEQPEKKIGTLFGYSNIPFLNKQLDSLNFLVKIYGCQIELIKFEAD
ncbi:WD repeat-containing protein 64 [Paramecium bursaria]